ncbi:MAG: S1 RNA-binding domain-containing protein [Acidobacteriota bacterium]
MTDDKTAGGDPEGDEAEDFASMLEASFQARSVEEGQTVEGILVSLTEDVAFVDVGGKGEATMDAAELRNDDGVFEVQVGDRVQAVVVSTAGGVRLSHRLARTAASREQLQNAFEAGLPVEGKVVRANKGGYEVRVAGQRAFCPASQIDTARGTDSSVHEGKVYTFRILEIKEGGKDLVLSRRVLLEEEERLKADELIRTLAPGVEMTGRVVSVRDYGAFVDLGAGVQGLLHVSEMGWTRVSSAASVVGIGEEISVQVLKVDPESRKISLSLKHRSADPWLGVAERYGVGKTIEGRVSRLAPFGAFVELEPGVEALAHMSTFPPTKGGWRAAVTAGERYRFRVDSVEPERRRIGVSLVDPSVGEEAPAEETPSSQAPAPGSEPSGSFGSLADKLRAAMERDRKKG